MSNTNERAELIARLNDYGNMTRNDVHNAIDMLEADALEIERTRKMYEKAHQGRADFRQAFRQARKAQQVAVPAGMALVPTEALLDIKNRVNTLATLSLKAERYSVGREIKQSIADILAAAQGAKP